MDETARIRAERVAESLRRYLWARSRCVGGESSSGQLSELTSRIQWGPCEFDGVRVELHLEPAIVWDRLLPDRALDLDTRGALVMAKGEIMMSGPAVL